jgi:hypothetical protein
MCFLTLAAAGAGAAGASGISAILGTAGAALTAGGLWEGGPATANAATCSAQVAAKNAAIAQQNADSRYQFDRG